MTRSSPLLTLDGAVEAGGQDSGVAAHYGDPIREQRSLARATVERPVAVDLSHRGVVSVSGEDRASWLTTLSSQVIDGLPVGASTETTLLSAQGRIEYQPHVVVSGDKVWLIVEAGQDEGLAEFLESMRFMLRVEVRDETADVAVIGSTVDLRGHAGVPAEAVAWHDPWPHIGVGGTTYAGTSPHPGEGWQYWEILVRRADLASLHPEWAGTMALEPLRIEAWRPRYATEVDARTIPHELDLMRTAVHMSKLSLIHI